MYAPNDNTGPKGLRGWWASPPRSGVHRLIAPYEYRHLRFFGAGRIAGGSVAAAAGVICLSYGVYGWAAFFLVLAARLRTPFRPRPRRRPAPVRSSSAY